MKINILPEQNTQARQRPSRERPPALHVPYGWPEWLLAGIVLAAFLVGGGLVAPFF